MGKGKAPVFRNGEFCGEKEIQAGDYVAVRVETVGARSLGCKAIAVVERLSEWSRFEAKILAIEERKMEFVV